MPPIYAAPAMPSYQPSMMQYGSTQSSGVPYASGYSSSDLMGIGGADMSGSISPYVASTNSLPTESSGNGFLSSFLGGTDAAGNKTAGWGGMALGAVQGIGNMYMGMKQFGLAKEQLATGKEQFNKSYGAQKTITNANLEDRQRARVASNAGAYESVGSYMQKNGVA